MLYIKLQIRTLFFLFLFLSLIFPLYGFSGTGAGTNVDPFEITTCTQLQEMEDNLSASYELNNSIDCVGISNFKPVGYCIGSCSSGDNNDIPFTGFFDGKDSTISNLNIVNLTTNNWGWGLFGYTINSTISNINLNNIFINVTGDNVGGLVGSSYHSSNITNTSSNGIVTGNNWVGGLVGTSFISSSISNSYSSGTVTGNYTVGGLVGYTFSPISNSYSNSDVIGNNDVGGLVGSSYASISNSYSSGDVSGNEGIGGLIGDSYASFISNSYSIGDVIGNSDIGGLIGYSYSSSVSNSYSTSSVTGNSNSGGLIGTYSSGTITDIFWNNISTSVNQTFGSGSNINATAIQDNISYFYGNSYLPMSNWDPAIWDFYNTTLPHLAYENYVVASTPAPSSAVSITSLPSVSFYAIAISLIGIIILLF